MNRKAAVLGIAAAAALAILGYRVVRPFQDPEAAARCHAEARALETSGKPEQALHQYRAAMAYDPGPIALNRDYQNLMRKSGRLDEARREYDQRAASFPKDAAAQYLAARLREGHDLESGMKRALELDPAFLWAHRALAFHYLDGGRDGEAMDHLQRAVDHPEAVAEDARTLVVHLFRTGRLDAIDALLSSWIARRPPFQKQGDPVFSLPLGRKPDGRALELHVMTERLPSPMLFELRLVRENREFRSLTVRAGEDDHVMTWTSRWLSMDRPEKDPPRNEWRQPSRPGLAQCLQEIEQRLAKDEKP